MIIRQQRACFLHNHESTLMRIFFFKIFLVSSDLIFYPNQNASDFVQKKNDKKRLSNRIRDITTKFPYMEGGKNHLGACGGKKGQIGTMKFPFVVLAQLSHLKPFPWPTH